MCNFSSYAKYLGEEGYSKAMKALRLDSYLLNLFCREMVMVTWELIRCVMKPIRLTDKLHPARHICDIP